MWEFRSFCDGLHRWSWRCYSDGTLARETMPSFNSLAEAMHDARSHGFEMYRDPWEIRALSR